MEKLGVVVLEISIPVAASNWTGANKLKLYYIVGFIIKNQNV
jgi:hypothetical protein